MSCGLSVSSTRRFLNFLKCSFFDSGQSLVGLVEDNLLIDVSSLYIFSHALAEFIQGLNDCLFLGGRAERFSISFLWMAVNSLVVSEQLWKVFGSSVGNGPFEFRRIEDFLLSFTFFGIFYRFRRLFLTVFTFYRFFYFFFDLFNWEFFEFVIDELGWLRFELQ